MLNRREMLIGSLAAAAVVGLPESDLMTPCIDMDGESGIPSQNRAHSFEASRFMLYGRQAQETVCRSWAPGVDKLVWCWFPLVAALVHWEAPDSPEQPVPNVLVHLDFPSGVKTEEEAARVEVRRTFCKHWNLPES